MFIGKYTHNLDAKGRIILPVEFREQLGDKFIITQGYEQCLFVYPLGEWEKFIEKLSSLPDNDKNARKVLRVFASGAIMREADKQGRVVISQDLRDFAQLDKEVVTIGALSRVEIWDSANWEKYNGDDDALSLEEAAASLPKLIG